MRSVYEAYSLGRHTLADLSRRTGRSVSTLRRRFDKFIPTASAKTIPAEPLALTFDATYFGRGCGLMIYRAGGRNIHWQHIESETLSPRPPPLRPRVACLSPEKGAFIASSELASLQVLQ